MGQKTKEFGVILAFSQQKKTFFPNRSFRKIIHFLYRFLIHFFPLRFTHFHVSKSHRTKEKEKHMKSFQLDAMIIIASTHVIRVILKFPKFLVRQLHTIPPSIAISQASSSAPLCIFPRESRVESFECLECNFINSLHKQKESLFASAPRKEDLKNIFQISFRAYFKYFHSQNLSITKLSQIMIMQSNQDDEDSRAQGIKQYFQIAC